MLPMDNNPNNETTSLNRVRVDAEKYAAEGHENAKDVLAVVRQLDRYREALETIAAQSSGESGSIKKSDCMAALASAALRFK